MPLPARITALTIHIMMLITMPMIPKIMPAFCLPSVEPSFFAMTARIMAMMPQMMPAIGMQMPISEIMPRTRAAVAFPFFYSIFLHPLFPDII